MRAVILLVLLVLAAVLLSHSDAWRARLRRIRIRLPVRRVVEKLSNAGVSCGCKYEWPKNKGKCACNTAGRKRAVEKRTPDGSTVPACSDSVTFSADDNEGNFQGPGDAFARAMEKLVNRCKQELGH